MFVDIVSYDTGFNFVAHANKFVDFKSCKMAA